MPAAITTPVGDVPAIVLVAALMGLAAVVVAIFLPHYRRLRFQRRIRKLPPPPIKKAIEPDLKLPRHGGESRPDD